MKTFFAFSLLMLVLLLSCTKDIQIDMPAYTPKVSIQCSLEVGKTPVLFLYNTVSYFDNLDISNLFIRNASVVISSATTTDSLSVDSIYDYIKCEYVCFYHGHIPVEANMDYYLTIKSGDSIYTAATTTNLVPAVIDSVTYVQQFHDIYGEHEGVVTYFSDVAGQTNYYRYEMVRFIDTTMSYREGKINSPCIGGDSVQVIELGRSVYNDNGLNGAQIKIIIEPAYSHYEGLSGYVKIETIDKNTYTFLDQLDRQKLGQTNPFVEPVFLQQGQFGSNAIGYFGSIVRSDSVLFVFPE